MKIKFNQFVFIAIAIFLTSHNLLLAKKTVENKYEDIYEKIESLFSRSDIPGLSFVLVDENNQYIKTWGYSDLENKIPVTSKTLFELGSTSKAFTALAILKLEKDSLIKLDDNVSKYIPWFKLFYNGNEVILTIKDLLYHTSGIPKNAISKIPEGNSDDMLEKTVQKINNLELKRLPGSKFEYSTINYDILGLIIEQISHNKFEDYLSKHIFKPLSMDYTSVGEPINDDFATGYKISFYSPKKYEAPKFRGNNPAGYVISNAEDISTWLKYQMALDSSDFQNIIKKSHIPDNTVIPEGLSLYCSGWFTIPYGAKKIYHGGLNPNYSSYIGFLPEKKLGVAILANSNSSYSAYLGDLIMKMLNNENISEIQEPENNFDNTFSLISIILGVFLLGILSFLVWIIKGIILKERTVKKINGTLILKIFGSLLLTLPFIYAIYLFPTALMDFSWKSAIVWAPNSYLFGCILFVCTIIGVWFLYVISNIVPTKNEYFRSLPLIVILSILSGLANMIIILLLINAIGSETRIIYLLFYFVLILMFYVSGRKIVQTKLIKISLSIVYDLRMKLINKIFLSSYQKFEKIENGRVFATLNQDTMTISNSVNIFISLVSSIITILGVFIYLSTISFIATMLILAVISSVAILYYFVSKKTRVLFEQARDTSNVFSGLIDGLLYGFKELCLSGLKKKEYTDDVEHSCSELRSKSGLALIKFVNAYLIGETLLIMVLGTVSFLIPFLFPEIPNYKLIGFIMIVLYLIGPINGILGAIPNLMRMKVAWNRINTLIEEIKPDLKLKDLINKKEKFESVSTLYVHDLMFEYENNEEDRNFKVGPINLEIKSGEILFVIGGNGSGKTTLANLLTGLYSSSGGCIQADGKKLNSNELGEYYSTVFSNHHIFKKFYGINTENKKEELEYLLKLLRLENKVSIEKDSFSTIKLSNGQRKRLSLMKCFIENSQIYLFDEWAADQDPEYKKVFYRKLLPEMKEQGKIVIAITHDDNYFDVADKIIKMDMGQIVTYHNVNDTKNVIADI